MKRARVRGIILAATLGFSAFAVPSGSCAPEGAPPRRIADLWYAHNALLVMLGAQDEVVATVAEGVTSPWMMALAPSLRKAVHLRRGPLSAEEMLGLKVDLVFLPLSARGDVPVLAREGLRAAPEGFTDFAGLLDCVKATAALLKTERAARRAQAYRAAVTEALTRSTPDPNGPRVLHIASLDPLQVDGGETIISEWIRHAGGRNAAQGVTGNRRPVTLEKILAWNPQIIVLAANAGSFSDKRRDPVWAQLDAVRQNRVYRNPAGLFLWDRYGPELLLQLDWARQIIRTGRVDTDVMSRKIISFYREFYGISLCEAQARRMLAALPPERGRPL